MPDKNLLTTLSSKTPLISVGIISADLMNLASDLAALEKAGVEMLHFDVMDGVFCPTMTVGSGFIKGVKSPLLKDVHLMIEDPLSKLNPYVAAGADIITVHVESTRYVHRVLQVLGDMENANDPARGILRGIALNPGTPLESAEPLLDMVEMVFLLAINPGWPGQKFPPKALKERLRRLIEMIRAHGRDILVGIDGGVKAENIGDIAAMGADIIVTGSAIFRPGSPQETAAQMIKTIKKATSPPGLNPNPISQ